MKQIFLSFCISLLCIGTTSAQLVINFSSAADVTPGGQVTVDVSVEDFDNIVLFQFGVLWDPSVLSYNSLTNVVGNPPLPDFSEGGNIGTPTVSALLDDGEIWTSWNELNTDQVTIPDGTILFSIVLDVVGDPCDETTFSVGEILGPVEVYDDNTFSNNIGVTSNDGMVNIDGDNCDGMGSGCDNFDGIILTIDDASVSPGQNVCVPVTVENFTDIESASIGVTWDESIIDYTGIANFALPGSQQFNDTNVPNGELVSLWTDPLGNTNSLADGSVIFEICFDAVGSLGQTSPVNFEDLPNIGTGFEIEFSSNGVAIPYCVNEGSVTIADGPVEQFIISGNSATGDMGTQVCVDYTTENFDDISSIQYTYMWDNSVIDFTDVQMTNPNLGGLSAGNFNQLADDKLRFTWNSSSGEGETLPDGALLFKLCFDAVGACESETNLMYVSFGGIGIEIGDGNSNSIPPSNYDLQEGDVTVTCAADECTISSTAVSCNGGNDGSANVTVTGGSLPSCVWFNDAGTMIGSMCLLSGQTAGDYTVEVTVGSTSTTKEVTIPEPDAISIATTVTDASCNGAGSVDIVITGGNGGYVTTWDPAGSDEDNLLEGDYTITVTDSKMCMESAMFSVGLENTTLTANVSSTPTTCSDSQDGTISFTAAGGCAPYSCDGCDGMFGPGIYNVIVSDADGQMVPAEVVVSAPDPIVIMLLNDSDELCTTGSDGFLNIQGSGGTGALSYSWTSVGGFTSNSQNINGLGEDTYTVCATDQNQCMTCMTWDIVEKSDTDPPSINNVSSTDNSCFGLIDTDCDGSIFASVAGATSITINGDPVTEVNETGLCAGDYLVVASNANGDTEITITVGEPEQIQISVETFCTSEDAEDGSIELTVTGGNGPYTYDWGTSDLIGESPGFVGAGSYNVLVEDMNGCLAMAQGINVSTCIDPNFPCFEALNILTPNADGMNDIFMINCVEQNSGTLTVYDRYGKDVYKEVGYANTWDGTDNSGRILNEGGYMWVLEVDFGNGQTELYKGTVTILRNL